MKHSALLAAIVLMAMAMPAAAEQLRLDHVVVSYAGINRAYAEAIARTVETARLAAVSQFGFDMPPTIKVFLTVDPQKERKLWTNGRDGIVLTLQSEEGLLRPEVSCAFNIYGMCHEVGHIAMYRLTRGCPAWMTHDAAEGWAHYLGSRLVDVVHAKEGADLWPDRYDYIEDGTKRLEEGLAAADDEDLDPKEKSLFKGVAAWKDLVEIVGDKGVARIFWAWGRAKYDLANPAPGLGQALWVSARDQRVAPWWRHTHSILIVNRANQQFDGGNNGRTRVRR